MGKRRIMNNQIKMKNLRIGQIAKEGRFEVEVVSIEENSFEVQYISGACYTYTQADLDSGKIEIVRY